MDSNQHNYTLNNSPSIAEGGHEKKSKLHINCTDCGISKLCLPALLAEAEVSHLESIIYRNSSAIKTGTHLYDTGAVAKHIYAIRSGAFKTYVNSYSGEEQITAFHLPGELIGLDGFVTGQYNSSAVALMESQICKIPLEMLSKLSGQIEGLRNQILRFLSQEITNDQELILILGQKNANGKMASLLVNLSARYEARKLQYDAFYLPMSRGELANYLGLTIETVSRVFKVFKEKKYIQVNGKHIHLTDLVALKRMAGIHCH